MTIHYTLRIREALGASWSRWFEGFVITHDAAGDTIISGEVMDEAAFYGLITRARDLGLTILALERQRDDVRDAGPGVPGRLG